MLLRTIVEEVGQRLRKAKPAVWIRTDANASDIQAIQEAGKPSEFDTLRLRPRLLESNPGISARELREKGSWKVLAKVVVLCERGRTPQIPWNLYRDIFLAFGPCSQKIPWRALVFCTTSQREFPPLGQEPGPEHVNGGYAMYGDPQSIVIYREEENYRVLLHELLHACGSDDISHPEWLREAFTETWAELFLIGILARGSVAQANELWRIQGQWIADQETILRRDHGVKGPENYAYRYTVGRREVLEKFGVGLPMASDSQALRTFPLTLRFTSPELLM